MSTPSPTSSLHPLVKLTREKLLSAKPDDYGAVRPDEGGLGVRVSPQHIDRAVSILDALVKGLTERRHNVRAGGKGMEGIATIQNEEFRFQLAERIPRKEHRLTKEEQGNEDTAKRRGRARTLSEVMWDNPFRGRPTWDYLPSNEFTFSIINYGTYGLRHTWKDGPSRRLEDSVPDIILEFERYPAAIQISRKEDEERTRRLDEARLQREEETRRRQAEQRRREALEDDALHWERAARIRSYVAAVRDRAAAEGVPKTVAKWCEWALGVADNLDPVFKTFSQTPRE